MAEEPRTSPVLGPEVRDWLRIFGAAKMALHPTKLALAFAALLLTFAWGWLLDGVWKTAGRGVEDAAITKFVAGQTLHMTLPAAEGTAGPCAVWTAHTLTQVQSALAAAMTLNFTGVWDAIGMLCHGTRWLVGQHLFFAVLFLLGTLAVWSLFGAAICRIAALEFAREDKIGVGPALRFAREKFFSGFFMSPLLPLMILAAVGLLLAIGGFFLWIPAIGNLFAIPFVLALLGGAAMALLLIGTVGGGSFFWPTVAVEGSDGFDAISRSFSYFFGRPVRTIVYGLTALFWGGVCWGVLKFILGLSLLATHACVKFGMGGFGTGWWGLRPEAGEGATKLDVLWQVPQLPDLYHWGQQAHMGGWEIFAAGCIGFWVLIVIGVLWAFLASYYFSASTIVYYLLRHEVDATDYDDVYLEETEEPAGAVPSPPAAAVAPGTSLPVVSVTAEPPPPAAPPETGG